MELWSYGVPLLGRKGYLIANPLRRLRGGNLLRILGIKEGKAALGFCSGLGLLLSQDNNKNRVLYSIPQNWWSKWFIVRIEGIV
jgi:hypothetical protein